MTIIAGLYSRTKAALSEHLCSTLVRAMSRHAGDQAEVMRGEAWLLAKIDIGALGSPALCVPSSGGAMVLAGEALLDGCEGMTRQEECDRIFAGLESGNVDGLRAANGQFCLAHYASDEHRLTLLTDKLGVRPLYYFTSPDLIAFASARRILESSQPGPLELDLHGVYDIATFGFPLGARTAYRQIQTLEAGEVVTAVQSSVSKAFYYRWDKLDTDSATAEEITRQLVIDFDAAVKRRLRRDRTAISFLSGGLDSRAIVAALRNHGVRVYSANFAPPETQDRVFGELAAKGLGTEHTQIECPPSQVADAYRKRELKKWLETLPSRSPAPDRPHCLWSGDGGSVGLGHVYMNPAAVEHFDRGDLAGGAVEFLRYNRIAGSANKAMTQRFREECKDWHVRHVIEEIKRLERPLDGRSLYLFLMLNDQRRHMEKHFENIDVDRLEFHLPFFDGRFIETIVRSPVHPFLGHALYHKWLTAINASATTVPWQSYPNHLACPIPFETPLRYQWGDFFGRTEDRKIARKHAVSALRWTFAARFPDHLINRNMIRVAAVMALLGSLNVGHILRVGEVFARSCNSPVRSL